MSSDYAIQIEDIAKCFRVYKRPIDRVRQCMLGDRRKLYKEVWALKGVTFKVSQGEAVGIIGRNGSGKSTLLEIITDTMKETAGTVIINGKVAALLELGAGLIRSSRGARMCLQMRQSWGSLMKSYNNGWMQS